MATITDEWQGTEYFTIVDFSHLEFWVGNAKQAAHFYRSIFGFQPVAYAGPETGQRDMASYVLRHKQITIILSTPIDPAHPANDWLRKHGDGVRDVAFTVENVRQAFDSCVSRGASPVKEPTQLTDDHGACHEAAIMAYGDTIHSLIQKDDYAGPWRPGFEKLNLPELPFRNPNLLTIDHVVANTDWGQMDQWKEYYETIFGLSNFVHFDENDISTKFSALKSRVMRSKNWRVKLPINEPAKGLKKSQIEEYIQFNEGAGVQHIALLTGDIVHSVRALRNNGVEFLTVPDSYYDEVPKRVPELEEDLATLQNLGILVDNDENGYLLQIFTKPVEDRPTLFFEIIQRKGSRGFGQGNFQALFESIEREQGRRGNL